MPSKCSGRSPQSDLGEDTIVRVGAREVRKRLAQYYVTEDGTAANRYCIDLPSGASTPDFRYTRAIPEPEPLPAAQPLPLVEQPVRRTKRGVIVAVASVAAALAIVFAVKLSSAAQTPDSSGILAPCSNRLTSAFGGSAPDRVPPVQPRLEIKHGESDLRRFPGAAADSGAARPSSRWSDLVPVFNQYVNWRYGGGE